MKLTGIVLFVLAATLTSCTDSEGLKGDLRIAVTDSPIDADNVSSVNLYFTAIDAKINGQWKSVNHFQQPVGINLLEYSGGNAFELISQPIDPGNYTEVKFTLNLPELGNSLLRNPMCNIVYQDGSSKSMYAPAGGSSIVLIPHSLAVKSHSLTDFTFDFDLRKSLTRDDQGNIIYTPSVRIIETALAGHISATLLNYNPNNRVVVYAYPSGGFLMSETDAPAAGEVRFKNAVTSNKVVGGKFKLGFLEAGSYDLVFTVNSDGGEFLSIMGQQHGVTVTAKETLPIEIDVATLSGS